MSTTSAVCCCRRRHKQQPLLCEPSTWRWHRYTVGHQGLTRAVDQTSVSTVSSSIVLHIPAVCVLAFEVKLEVCV